jgi:carbamoylphosphate synthase large subunit
MKILFPNPTVHIRSLIDSMRSKNCQVDLLIPEYREVPDDLENIFGSKQYRAKDEVQYLSLLKDACAEQYDYIFPNYFDNHVLEIANMNEKHDMLGINKRAATILLDKHSYYTQFESLGISLPLIFGMVPAGETKVTVDSITYPCIVKPTDGTGSSGVRKINNEKELRLFFAKDQLARHYEMVGRKSNSDYMIQEYIEGTVLCPMGHISNGNLSIDFCQEIINTAEPFFPERMLSMPVIIDNIDAIKDDLVKFCASIGLDNTAWRCEVIIRDGRHYFIDFGARIGGLNNQMLLEHAGEKDYGWKLIDSILNQNPHSTEMKNHAVFKELDLRSGEIDHITCSSELAAFLQLPQKEISVSKTDTDVFDNGFAITIGSSFSECLEKQQRISESLSMTYKQAL